MQLYRSTTPDSLLEAVEKMKLNGYRLAQISVTKKDTMDIIYSFIKEQDMIHVRMEITPGQEIESVSGIYPYAFLYENEMKDLFGVKVLNISVDYGGHFYKLKTTGTGKTPY